MADSKVAFELVAPERLLASIDCDMVVIPGEEGDFGVLPNHAPLMSLLRPGVISVYQGDKVDQRMFVGGGFAEVNEQGCTVLAERAEPVDEIPVEVARQDLRNAEEDLGDAKTDLERERLTEARPSHQDPPCRLDFGLSSAARCNATIAKRSLARATPGRRPSSAKRRIWPPVFRLWPRRTPSSSAASTRRLVSGLFELADLGKPRPQGVRRARARRGGSLGLERRRMAGSRPARRPG